MCYADGPCCGWWGPSRRRKGGQVRFSATQTGMLEQRFNVNKYLSTEDRRALAAALGLSDKQVRLKLLSVMHIEQLKP